MFIHLSDTIEWGQSALHPVLCTWDPLAPFGYICSVKSPLLVTYNLHVNTHYKLVNINVYIGYDAFANTLYI